MHIERGIRPGTEYLPFVRIAPYRARHKPGLLKQGLKKNTVGPNSSMTPSPWNLYH